MQQCSGMSPERLVIDTVQEPGADDFIALDAHQSGVVRGDFLPPPQPASVVRGESREVRKDNNIIFRCDQNAGDRERLDLERLLRSVCSYNNASACIDDAEGNLIRPSNETAACGGWDAIATAGEDTDPGLT
jgi:hypothetical protein